MSNTSERQEKILELLAEKRYVRVKELANRFQVSLETIRRDLEQMEKQGGIIKSHGAVSFKGSVGDNSFFVDREIANREEKKNIAKRAAMLVEDKDVIAIIGSTTTVQMAVYLKEKNNLVVITNGIQIATIVGDNPSNKVILLGGEYVPQENCIMGFETEKAMEQYFPDKAFFSSTGISVKDGITSYDSYEKHLLRCVIKNATDKYYLCDHTKFQKKGMYATAEAEAVTAILTDTKTPYYTLEEFRKKNIHIIISQKE